MFEEAPLDVTVIIDDPVRFTCRVYGKPLSTVMWWRDGVQVTSDDRTIITTSAIPTDYLRISELYLNYTDTATDAGTSTYTCIAENVAGIIAANATLTAQGTEDSLFMMFMPS